VAFFLLLVFSSAGGFNLKWQVGDRLTSVAIEGMVVGTVTNVDFDRLKVIWPDGRWSYENYDDVALVSRPDTIDFLKFRQPPTVHRKDVPGTYIPHLQFYAEGNDSFRADIDWSTREQGPQINLVDDRPQRGITNPVILNAYYKLKEEREKQEITDYLLTKNPEQIPVPSAVAAVTNHISVGTEARGDWEPGDVVSVSRPGRNAGHLTTAHIERVRHTTADIIWVDPVSGQEQKTTEPLTNLIFLRHDSRWRADRESDGRRLEAEVFDPKSLGYDVIDYGYPTRLIADPMVYEVSFKRSVMRDYLGNQIRKHPVGDNNLNDLKLMELQYAGHTRGFQPFNGFERTADYLWR